jgi:hypothetical protein
VSEAAPTLVRLEAEISTALTEHHDQLVRHIAIALVEIAVQERAAKNGNGRVAGPKLCSVCRTRLAAEARTVCHTCRRRQRNERERLREAHAAEVAAAAQGERGLRAQALALGEETVVSNGAKS